MKTYLTAAALSTTIAFSVHAGTMDPPYMERPVGLFGEIIDRGGIDGPDYDEHRTADTDRHYDCPAPFSVFKGSVGQWLSAARECKVTFEPGDKWTDKPDEPGNGYTPWPEIEFPDTTPIPLPAGLVLLLSGIGGLGLLGRFRRG